MGKKQLSSALRYYGALAFSCLLGYAACAITVLANGRRLVYAFDGTALYLNTLIAIGKNARRAIRSLLSGSIPAFPQFNFTVGYGAEISTRIWDPLNWLSVFVPVAYTEYLYYFLIFLRMFLACASFSAFCFYKGNGKRETFVAALCYGFSGFMLFWGILRHPHFINAAILLPLVLLGIERIFKEGKPVLFTLSIALSLFVTVYLSYMICLFAIVYALCKYLFSAQRKSLNLAYLVRTHVLAGIVGLLISGVSAFPTVASIASQQRLSASVAVPLFHEFSHYLRFFSNAMGNAASASEVAGYIGPVSIVFLVVFLVGRRHFDKATWRAWAFAAAGVVVCTLVPFLGHVIHGFSYVTTRWYFIVGFCFSYIVCLSVPVIGKLSASERKRAYVAVAVIVALSMLNALTSSRIAETALQSVPFALICVAVLWGALQFDPRTFSLGTGLCTIVGVAFVCFVVCASSPFGANYQQKFFKADETIAEFYTKNNPYKVIDSLPRDERAAYRYSYPRIKSGYLNESVNLNRNGMSCYFDPFQAVDDFRDSMGVADCATANHYDGSDSRLALDAFSGAKYFVASKKEKKRIPATYESMDRSENGHALYATDYALPLAFTYDAVIPKSQYDASNMVQRQEGILQGCVLDDALADGSQMPVETIKASSQVLPYKVKAAEGIELKGNAIVVQRPGAKLRISFEGVEKSETYLCLGNLKYEDFERTRPGKNAAPYKWVSYLDGVREKQYDIEVTSKLGKKKVTALTPYATQYCEKESWAMNLGYSSKKLRSARLSFSKKGTYTFDSMQVIAQPVEPVKGALKKLQQQGATDIQRASNRVSAQVSLASDKGYVLFTLGYSRGWSATVDGEAADVYAGNIGFVTVPVEGRGTHDVVIEYHRPGLREGAICSVVGWVLFILACFARRKGVQLGQPMKSAPLG